MRNSGSYVFLMLSLPMRPEIFKFLIFFQLNIHVSTLVMMMMFLNCFSELFPTFTSISTLFLYMIFYVFSNIFRLFSHFQMCTPQNTPATPPNFPETLMNFSKLSTMDAGSSNPSHKFGTSPVNACLQMAPPSQISQSPAGSVMPIHQQ